MNNCSRASTDFLRSTTHLSLPMMLNALFQTHLILIELCASLELEQKCDGLLAETLSRNVVIYLVNLEFL